LRSHVKTLVVIDDLANQNHECDLLLNQNFGAKGGDYSQLVSARCKVLAGSKYALLRPDFARLREDSLSRRRQAGVRQLLIGLGGVDKDNVTGMLLRTLGGIDLPSSCRIYVALGAQAPWVDDVRRDASSLPVACEIHVGTSRMAELMLASDLAIGAAGTMALERCCLGLPTLTTILAENQRAGAQALWDAGACFLLPLPISLSNLADAFNQVRKPGVVGRMQEAAAAVTDGHGLSRVLEQVRDKHACV
jgi:UDP-2,4-diacetamido-2,4,6-trideoxy-beta-L-altropyranose hydrolase